MEPVDVAVVGGGILGTSVAYWLAARYDGRFVVLEREARVAEHTSRRNTGVVHRPFYLHPKKRKVFARAAQVSYGLWKRYAAEKRLPFEEIGTYEVALNDESMGTLETYVTWAAENGMAPGEVELLDRSEMRRREPNVRCAGAILSKTDTCVDYRAFTEALKADAEALGTQFLFGGAVQEVHAYGGDLEVLLAGQSEPLRARFLVNCAGGEAIDVAHGAGVGLEYTDIHFRGEYWIVDPRVKNLVKRNVYSVPRHKDMPFLDPHWVVRANGGREIGPNAVPVPRANQYTGLHVLAWGEKLFEPPVANKVRLLMNPEFMNLAAAEMLSSVSKAEMLGRVQRFLPALKEEHLVGPGTAGVRSQVIDARGGMAREAIEVPGPQSYHILNYNSPGATGAPAYAAYLVDRLAARGDLDHVRKNPKPQSVWDWATVAKALGLAA
ncbi:MAG: FAD-dependent oxidoreductase [Methanobacteriota archaeon]|nr:MAG: FAD-dependent oxidoreductase [Euryarchaeota archaeon]